METETETNERVRLTVSVRPEVHAAFLKLSKASGQSMSRCMGDWLFDTLDAVQFMADKMAEARAAPRRVAHQLHAYALGLADETGAILEKVRADARADARDGGKRSAPRAAAPPSSNTGGKPPLKGNRRPT